LPTFRLVLEYDGTDFAGWQAQAAGTRTVQGVLEQAIERVTGIAAPVMGAGRTDAGVHAEGQVASVRVETRLDPATLGRALNALLPSDLAVRSVAEAEPGFHALRDARRKLYLYRVWNGAVRSPLRERWQHWVRAPLDLAAMARAAAPLEGRHDFASFETRARERAEEEPRSTVRTLFRVEIAGQAGGEVRLAFEGDGFLRYMVRTLAGSLLQVGRGLRPPADLARMLGVRDRRQAGPTAPARGLTLVWVDAGNCPDFRGVPRASGLTLPAGSGTTLRSPGPTELIEPSGPAEERDRWEP
jgi:tRNA pseudouridine38-40 synthase